MYSFLRVAAKCQAFFLFFFLLLTCDQGKKNAEISWNFAATRRNEYTLTSGHSISIYFSLLLMIFCYLLLFIYRCSVDNLRSAPPSTPTKRMGEASEPERGTKVTPPRAYLLTTGQLSPHVLALEQSDFEMLFTWHNIIIIIIIITIYWQCFHEVALHLSTTLKLS